MLAILITTVSYVGFAVICGAAVVRQASGNFKDIINGTYTNCTGNIQCEWGLQNSFLVHNLFCVNICALSELRLRRSIGVSNG